jgi:phage regulator Rha-like protein
MELTKFNQVSSKIIAIRNQNVILDSDVATLYGVQTMRINEAVKNNPDKFPDGYIFEINNQELANLLSKISIANVSPKTRHLPKAFTEKGLYMLATILKSQQATQTTIAIVEAFTQMRQMQQAIIDVMRDNQNEEKQTIVAQKTEKFFGAIVEQAMETVEIETQTGFELNLAALKIKHTVKRTKKIVEN